MYITYMQLYIIYIYIHIHINDSVDDYCDPLNTVRLPGVDQLMVDKSVSSWSLRYKDGSKTIHTDLYFTMFMKNKIFK